MRVRGEVDWRRRFDHMQQHTGQHLLSAVFADLFGYETASVHFGADRSSLDLDVGAIDAESVRRGRATRERARVGESVCERELRGFRHCFRIAETPASGGYASHRDHRWAGPERLRWHACPHDRRDRCDHASKHRTHAQSRRASSSCAAARVVRQARADFETLSAIALSVKASIAEARHGGRRKASSSGMPHRCASVSKPSSRCTRRASCTTAQRRRPAVMRVATVRRDAGSVEESARSRRRLLRCSTRCSSRRSRSHRPSSSRPRMTPASTPARCLKAALTAAGGRGGGSARLAQGTVPNAAELATIVAAVQSSS